LAGCHIRFTARTQLQAKMRAPDDSSPREVADIEWLADQQVGPTGTMTIHDVKWFDCPIAEMHQRCKLGEPPPFEVKPSLYLEWHSQNGRVVLELIDPEIEFVERRSIQAPVPGAHLITDPMPVEAADAELSQKASRDGVMEDSPENSSQAGLGVGIVGLDDDGHTTIEEQFYRSEDEQDSIHSENEQEPHADLQRELDEQAAKIDWAIQFDCDDEDKPEHIRELELMDALIERRTADWMIDMIDHPEQLPRPCDLSEEQAEGPLKSILAQLAIYGISIHVCPHYTPKEAYRWLLEDIFPEELAHKELRHTQWVQGFNTGESSCPACDAEFEREWAKRESELHEDRRSPPLEPPF
jgi:hypothetical protein